ncbi:MAG: hypothetical protein HRT67_02715 [Flavobacteriaceae bacterium]|nr:hypothetical protein [Flavobacteriaceae bacterium]
MDKGSNPFVRTKIPIFMGINMVALVYVVKHRSVKAENRGRISQVTQNGTIAKLVYASD